MRELYPITAFVMTDNGDFYTRIRGGRGSRETALRSGLILGAFRPNQRRSASSDLALLARVKGSTDFLLDIANRRYKNK